MAALVTVTPTRAGVDYGWANAAAGGDTFTNTGFELVCVVNGHGSASRTVTFVTSATVDGLAVGDKAVTIAAGGNKVFGPFPKYAYGTTVSITYSDSGANVTVAVLKVVPELA